jgi:hypothetical protein
MPTENTAFYAASIHFTPRGSAKGEVGGGDFRQPAPIPAGTSPEEHHPALSNEPRP